MSYQHATLATLNAALAARLHDTSYVRWVSAELDAYILEALRTWNAASAFYRDRGTFATSTNECIYDLATQLPTLLLRSLTDASLVSTMEYHLLEPATPAAWTGSEQFVQNDLVGALQRRRDQFLFETGSVLTRVQPAYTFNPDGRAALADTIADVRRAEFVEAGGTRRTLRRADEWALQSFAVGWEDNPAAAHSYSIIVGAPVSLQIAPPPPDSGTLDLLTVSTGAALDPATGVVLGVPDDFAWVVKWGALADLLGKDGPAHDPERAAYCEQRYQQGCELARWMTTVLQAQINGQRAAICTVSDLDNWRQNWHNEAAGTPDQVAMAGMNMLVLAGPPDAGPHSVTVDVVRNMPVPATSGTAVQVGREHLDVILDYAEHLAAFKMAGAEFQATFEHVKRFFRLAAQLNNRWKAAAVFADVLHDRPRGEEREVPRREPADRLALAGDMND